MRSAGTFFPANITCTLHLHLSHNFRVECDEWNSEPPFRQRLDELRSRFLQSLMWKLVSNRSSEEKERNVFDPRLVTQRLIAYVVDLTRKSKETMQASGEPLPHDYAMYPGKMDHTTCVCLRVGEVPLELLD